MGDETKASEVQQGNTDPLRSARKPSTAESVDTTPAEVAAMPTREEIERREDTRAPGMQVVSENASEGENAADDRSAPPEERADIRGEAARRKRGKE